MAYGAGSEAVWLGGAEELRQQPRRQRSRAFEVIEGEGLDARARQGVGTSFVANLVRIAIVAAVLFLLGLSRVAVSSATVAVLKENASMRADIKTAQSARADLEVQRSLLSAGTRIDRIATQNLGMVLSTSGETIDVSRSFAQDNSQAQAQVEGSASSSQKSQVSVEDSANQQVNDVQAVSSPSESDSALV